MDKNHKIENLLRIKGINAQGYGIIPKLVVRDTRLSIEAKAIYSYISSFAGNGTTAFPSVAIMTTELDISIPRFYRHRAALIELNYIEITQERSGDKKSRFGRNIYELIQNPIPLCQRKIETTSGTDELPELTEESSPDLSKNIDTENTKKKKGTQEQTDSNFEVKQVIAARIKEILKSQNPNLSESQRTLNICWGDKLSNVCERLAKNNTLPKVSGSTVEAIDVLKALEKGLYKPDDLLELLDRWTYIEVENSGKKRNNKYGYLISMIYNEFF